MSVSKSESDAIYLYIKRIEQFYLNINSLLNEAIYLDYRYGLIVSGLDQRISSASWFGLYNSEDLAVISGNLVGAKSLPDTVSGWRVIYVDRE